MRLTTASKPASPNQAKKSSITSAKPQSAILILSQTTGNPLPITPFYARALRTSLKQYGLRPPETKPPGPITAQKSKISKHKPRKSHRSKSRRYRPSPLRREVSPSDVRSSRFGRAGATALGSVIPVLNPKLLRKLSKLKILCTKEEVPRMYVPPRTSHISHIFPTPSYPRIQPQIYHCRFARLQPFCVPERGTLEKRGRVMDARQELRNARADLIVATGVSLVFQARSADEVEEECGCCVARAGREAKKAGKRDWKGCSRRVGVFSKVLVLGGG